MMKHPIGIYEKALPMQGRWYERLNIAAEAGFNFIEISIDESERLQRLDWSKDEIRDLQSAVLDTGIQAHTIILSALRTYPLGGVSEGIRHNALDILQKAIVLAAETGIRIVQIPGYFNFYEANTSDSRKYFVEGLHDAVTWAAQTGVMLAIENMDGDDVVSLKTGLDIVQEINSPWFQLYPDIGNLAANNLDIVAELEVAKDAIVSIHLKDTRLGEYRRVPYGEGIVDFTKAFKTLKRLNYAGPFLLEMWNDDAPNAVQIVSEARHWMLRKMQEAGLN